MHISAPRDLETLVCARGAKLSLKSLSKRLESPRRGSRGLIYDLPATARPARIQESPEWKPIAIILMLPTFLLAVIGLTTPNPTSVGQEGRVARSPEGIVRVTRHPFLIGVGLWAVLHLVANGDVASFIFFGAFAVTALAGTVSIDAKRRRALGPGWQTFAAQTSIVPFAAIAAGRTRFNPGEITAWRWVAAVIAYALMLSEQPLCRSRRRGAAGQPAAALARTSPRPKHDRQRAL